MIMSQITLLGCGCEVKPASNVTLLGLRISVHAPDLLAMKAV